MYTYGCPGLTREEADNVPLNGNMSDLTAIFFVRKVDEDNLTLSFIDLHVM